MLAQNKVSQRRNRVGTETLRGIRGGADDIRVIGTPTVHPASSKARCCNNCNMSDGFQQGCREGTAYAQREEHSTVI